MSAQFFLSFPESLRIVTPLGKRDDVGIKPVAFQKHAEQFVVLPHSEIDDEEHDFDPLFLEDRGFNGRESPVVDDGFQVFTQVAYGIVPESMKVSAHFLRSCLRMDISSFRADSLRSHDRNM